MGRFSLSENMLAAVGGVIFVVILIMLLISRAEVDSYRAENARLKIILHDGGAAAREAFKKNPSDTNALSTVLLANKYLNKTLDETTKEEYNNLEAEEMVSKAKYDRMEYLYKQSHEQRKNLEKDLESSQKIVIERGKQLERITRLLEKALDRS